MSESFASGPCIGASAPELALPGLERRPGHGEPRVLAFVPDEPDADPLAIAPPAELAAIRAELRGLGAELVVVSPGGAWSVRADDAPARLDTSAAATAAAAAGYGIAAGDTAIFVIDGRGAIRFRRELDRSFAPWAALARALAIAGSAVHARDAHDARQRVLFTRREWTVTCLVVGCASAFLASCKEQERPADRHRVPVEEAPPDVDVTLTINGKRHALRLEPRTSLLDALRERLGLTGTKKGCDAGQCGACTVLLGGKRVTSCLTLAVMAQGRDITTIEGLAGAGGALHPMQRAFVEHDGLQCGYCTPGQIVSAVGLLGEGHATSDDEVREQMSGNLCRCGAYPNIIAAIQAARRSRG